MANPVAEAAVESVELESVHEKLPDLVAEFGGAYNLFKKRAKKVDIANVTLGGTTTRAAWRVPMWIQGGSPIQVGTGDSTSLLRGTGSQTQAFAMSPVWTFNVCEITHLAEMATEGKERGVVSIKVEEIKRSLRQFLTGQEGLINGDGSGAIDQIPATATITTGGSGAQTSIIAGMNVAARFTDQQVVSVFPSEGGVTRGTATISYVDPVTNTLYFSTALPSTGGATAVGDYLMVQGTSGAVGSSILGIQYWNVNSNTGTLAGLPRASYPGRLSTPTINLNGAQLVPSTEQRALVLLGRAMGEDNEAAESMIWYGPPEQIYTFASQFYSRMVTLANDKSESALDTGVKGFPKTALGRDFQISWTQNSNRIDGLVMDNWLFGELKEAGLYDFGGGNTIMPVPDVGTSNGTYLTNKMFVYEMGYQLCNAAPRSGIYVQNCGSLTV